MRSKRYQPTRLRNGVVLQSGQDIRPKGEALPGQIKYGPFRAIVLQTNVPNGAANAHGSGVECEVILVKTGQIVSRCRVLQASGFGVHSAQPWIPRPTTRARVDALSLTVTVPGTFPKYADLDGDLVLLDFVEGDPNAPVILGALQHENTERKLRSSEGDEANGSDPDPNAATAAVTGGWNELDAGATRGTAYSEEHYLNHRGTEFRINRQGDVLIDTVGAFGADPDESASGGQGQIRLRLKNQLKFTVECAGVDVLEVYKDALGAVHVDLGEGATEPVVLGNKLTSWLLAHVHPTGTGPSGPPVALAGGVSLTPITPSLVGDHLSAAHRVK